jgi:hypothetical protein
MDCKFGESRPIKIFFRTAGVVPIIEISTIPSTGSVGRSFGNMLIGSSISYAKCYSEAVNKALNPNSIKYLSNLLKSKNISFPENLTVKNCVGFGLNGYIFIGVIINANSDDPDIVYNDFKFISTWYNSLRITNNWRRSDLTKIKFPEKIVNIEDYAPIMATQPSDPGYLNPNTVGGRSRRRKKIKKSKRTTNKKRKTAKHHY